MSRMKKLPSEGRKKERINLSKSFSSIDYPNLIQTQFNSYKWFLENNLKELFSEINPVEDNTGKLWALEFLDYRLGDPNTSADEAAKKGLSYDAPLFFNVRLINKHTGEIKEQELFIADIPLMNSRGTFIINGNERTVVHQIVRSEGVLYLDNPLKLSDRNVYLAKLIPERGPWFNFETNKNDVLSIKLASKRPKILITQLLRVFGYSTNAEILRLFSDVDNDPDHKYIEATLAKDFTKTREEAVIDIYRKLRPDVAISFESAQNYIESIFFNARRVYLGKTGRYQLNKRLGLDIPVTEENYVLHPSDIIAVIKRLIQVNNGVIMPDDMDHMSNRRLRSVGELVSDYIRVGVRRIEKNIKDRMSLHASDALLTPSVLVSTRPITASINEFFGSSTVSRYMEQANILAELGHKREITAAGPGGLTKDRATFSVRDIHYSQYSRICPIETPEGPNVGLVNHLAVYARVNEYGFIEAPYIKVIHEIESGDFKKLLPNRVAREDIKGDKGKILIKKASIITKEDVEMLTKAGIEKVAVKPYITGEIVYLDAEGEEKYSFTNATVDIDVNKNIIDDMVPLRSRGSFSLGLSENVNFIDASSDQIAGTGFALVPYAAHNDSQRILMAANMQRQAIPLIRPEAPIVGTGFEEVAARSSGRAIYSPINGEVFYVDSEKVVLIDAKKKKYEFKLEKFIRTNQNTCFHQQSVVNKGQKVKVGELIVDGPCMDHGELALGRNLKVAYMMWEGYNYEDGVIVSNRLIKDNLLTSVHIHEYQVEVRETRLGDEQITSDIPNVSANSLRNLDESGIVRIGAYVESNDVLVGIIAQRGEQELSAEERLLRAIFGEYAKDVRDNSLKMPNGESGIVIGTQILSKDKGDKLNPGVIHHIKIWVAKTHQIGIGDKLAGRYGDKGVISKVLPLADMPYTEDGTPVDIVLSPLFLKRMNMGQLLESHMGMAGSIIGKNVAVPISSSIDENKEAAVFKEAGMEGDQKVTLYDGRTGEPFIGKIAVGIRYILKLNHLSDEKIHARATGSYNMVTQQPLGGKAQLGGQRFGEMEVWALEAYGAAHVLQEMLTYKSDDVMGRALAYRAIIQKTKVQGTGIPEGYRVLEQELKALSLNVERIGEIALSKREEEKVEAVLESTPLETQTVKVETEIEPGFEPVKVSDEIMEA